MKKVIEVVNGNEYQTELNVVKDNFNHICRLIERKVQAIESNTASEDNPEFIWYNNQQPGYYLQLDGNNCTRLKGVDFNFDYDEVRYTRNIDVTIYKEDVTKIKMGLGDDYYMVYDMSEVSVREALLDCFARVIKYIEMYKRNDRMSKLKSRINNRNRF